MVKICSSDNGLTQGESAIVGRNFRVGENLETAPVQPIDCAPKKSEVLKRAAAQAYLLDSRPLAQTKANRLHHIRNRIMKAT